ncbi:MAG: type II toxin-antitoxin system VapC family toxin [Nitrospirota bacterium]
MYFLDTNTCIYYLNGKSENIKKRILLNPPDHIKIPSVVKAELLLGAYKSKKRDHNIEKIEAFMQPFEIVPFDDCISYEYAGIRQALEAMGKIVGPNDLLIAAIVRFHQGVLVTNNIREFEVIEGLKLENWF